VNYAIRVQVMQRLDELFSNLLYCAFRKSLIVLQNVEQLTLSVLSNNTELSISFKSIKHKNDVFMVQFSKNSDLLTEVADIFFTFPMLRDKLHCYSEACVLPSRLHSTDKDNY
jgi:hypothetical protein